MYAKLKSWSTWLFQKNDNSPGVIAIANLFTLAATGMVFGQTGSGTFEGTFFDLEPVQASQTYVVNWENDWIVPTAGGHGTDHYEWGLWSSGVYYLDGDLNNPLTSQEAFDLGLTNDEFIERITYEVIPSGNEVKFTGFDFSDQPKGETFVAGKLFYRNSVSRIGTSVDRIGFEVQSNSSDPGFEQLMNLTIDIITTPNVYDEDGIRLEEESADFLYFVERPELGSFRVFEDQSTDVEILMEFNSLHLIGFGAVGEPSVGFVDSSITIPEPSTWLLVVLGLTGIAGGIRRRLPPNHIPNQAISCECSPPT